MTARILIADADPIQRRHLEATVNRFGFTAEGIETGPDLRERLLGAAAARAPAIDLLILDLASKDRDSGALLAALDRGARRIPTIVQAAPGAIDQVLPAIRAGALDFIVKPVGAERLKVSLENALHLASLEDEVRRLGRMATQCASFAELVGTGEAMARVVRLGQKAARATTPVILEGEAGTGKEAVARAIHGASDRRGRPFVTVDCRTLPADRAFEILFGGEPGTRGDEKRIGKIVEAHGGTLFLDEVGTLPLDVQSALLRAVQSGEIAPLGARRPHNVDVRFIVATSQNLIELVTRGLFREDLFYRVTLLPIALPPLRARREDIAALARRFCARFAAELGKAMRGIGAEALALLESYDWPGNVRQLENVAYRAIILSQGEELGVAEFPQIAACAGNFAVRIPPVPAPVADRGERKVVTVEIKDPNVVPLLDEAGRMRRLDRLEAEAIRFALGHYRGHISAVARGLGIGRSTLYRKMKEYGITAGGEEEPAASRAEAARQGRGDAAA